MQLLRAKKNELIIEYLINKIMNPKTTKIIFWVTTTLIFLFEGVMPVLFRNNEEGKVAMQHLGYPAYIGTLLLCFKVPGALALMIPQVSAKIKEWAYAGFTIDFLGASLSYFFVDGLVGFTFFPFVVLAILAVSYICYHKLQGTKGII
jgi:hypothetical protein